MRNVQDSAPSMEIEYLLRKTLSIRIEPMILPPSMMRKTHGKKDSLQMITSRARLNRDEIGFPQWISQFPSGGLIAFSVSPANVVLLVDHFPAVIGDSPTNPRHRLRALGYAISVGECESTLLNPHESSNQTRLP